MGFFVKLNQLRWLDRLRGTKKFKYGEEKSILCDCTHEKQTLFKVLLTMVAMATSHTLLRCFLIKQAHLLSFWFVLCNEPKFWQFTDVFSAFTCLNSKVSFIFVETDLHLRALSDCKWQLDRYGHCYVKKLFHCVLSLNVTLPLELP